MTVQRYDAMHKDVWTDESGKYVRYEDYAALKAKMDMINDLMSAAEQANALAKENVESLLKERDDARTELSSAMLTISQITEVVGTNDTLSISQQVTELASRCSALAAESALVKERHLFIRALSVSILEHSGGRADWRGAMEDAGDLIRTVNEVYAALPATDAAIANIQAQGVEKFAEFCRLKGEVRAFNFFNDAALNAEEFASQLRKEPAHD